MAHASDKSPKFTPDTQNIQKFWFETYVLMQQLASEEPHNEVVELNNDIATTAIASVQQQIRSEQIPNRPKNEPPR